MSGSAPVLQMEMRHRVGALTLDVSFSLRRPWTVLFGPSGSGKTTLLRAIQGLVRPDVGRIVVGSECVLDTAAGLCVPAHRRMVRSAGQAARLFPGMTVGENLRFGVGAADASTIEEVLRICRIEGLAGKLPGALSGGERQRVSVARAAVSVVTSAMTNGGALLMLDEPFAGLDFALRDVLAVELQAWLVERRTLVLSVTHDVGEAFLLGAEVLRLEDGRIAAQGPVEVVLAAERERLLGRLGDGERSRWRT